MSDENPRHGLLTPPFWIALGFGLICISAGLGFVLLAPRLHSRIEATHTLGKHVPGR